MFLWLRISLILITRTAFISHPVMQDQPIEDSMELYGPSEMMFISKYLEKSIVRWSEMEYVSYADRVEICMLAYESYQGVHLGTLISPEPFIMVAPLLFIEVTFRLSKVEPKQLELLACGFEGMTFSNYSGSIKNMYLFKGEDTQSVYILQEGKNQQVHFVCVIRGINWLKYVHFDQELDDDDSQLDEQLEDLDDISETTRQNVLKVLMEEKDAKVKRAKDNKEIQRDVDLSNIRQRKEGEEVPRRRGGGNAKIHPIEEDKEMRKRGEVNSKIHMIGVGEEVQQVEVDSKIHPLENEREEQRGAIKSEIHREDDYGDARRGIERKNTVRDYDKISMYLPRWRSNKAKA